MIRRPRPTEGSKTLPIFQPLLQQRDRKSVGRAKKMNMIRHKYIPANKPETGLLPGIDNNGSAILGCENTFAILAANREVNNYRFVVAFNYCRCARCLRPMSDSPVIADTTCAFKSLGADEAAPSIGAGAQIPLKLRIHPGGTRFVVSQTTVVFKVEFRSVSHRPLTPKSRRSLNQSGQCSLQSSRASDELVPMR